MTTDRRFCRISTSPTTAAMSLSTIPEDGICLSAFVVLTSPEHPHQVLLGKIDPTAPWDHLGALDLERVEVWKDRWMLPSSHLLYLEAPQDAAKRILDEQLGRAGLPLTGPSVVSEVYAPARHPSHRQHWDLEFLFRGEAPETTVGSPRAWRELRFVDPRSLRPEAFARGHDEVLAHAGVPEAPAT